MRDGALTLGAASAIDVSWHPIGLEMRDVRGPAGFEQRPPGFDVFGRRGDGLGGRDCAGWLGGGGEGREGDHQDDEQGAHGTSPGNAEPTNPTRRTYSGPRRSWPSPVGGGHGESAGPP
jgi:hypothetical protein